MAALSFYSGTLFWSYSIKEAKSGALAVTAAYNIYLFSQLVHLMNDVSFLLLGSLCKYLMVASGRAFVFINRARAQTIMKVLACIFVFHLGCYCSEILEFVGKSFNFFLWLDTSTPWTSRLGTMLLAWFVCMKLVERLGSPILASL